METCLWFSLYLECSLWKQLQRCVTRPTIGFGQNEKPCDQTVARLNWSFNTSEFFRGFESNCILHFWGSIEMKDMFLRGRSRGRKGGVWEREREEKNLRKVLLLRKKKKSFSWWKHSLAQNPRTGFIIKQCIFVSAFHMQTLSCFIVENGKKKLFLPFKVTFNFF